MKKALCVFLSILMSFLLSVPVLAAESFPSLYSDTVYLAERSTGKVLYSSNEHSRVPVGYLSKIVTGLLVFENVSDLDDMATVTAADINGTENDLSAYLKTGEQMSVSDLLYCLLVRGGCDSANVLARYVSGDTASFVVKMNEYAQALGCKDTVFKNPSGMDAAGQYTTAYDMYLIARAAADNDLFMSYSDVNFKRIPATNMTKDDRYFNSNNYLIVTNTSIDKKYRDAYHYSKAHGMMSSETDEAGNSVVTLFKSDNTECICVILNAPRDPETKLRGSYMDAKALGTWVYSSFTVSTIAQADSAICEAPVSCSGTADYIVLVLSDDVTALFPAGTTADDFETVVTVDDDIKAPVKKGDKLGHIQYYFEGELYAECDLEARNNLDSNLILVVIDKMMSLITNPLTWIVIATLAAVIILIFAGRIRRKRKRTMYKDANRFRG